MAAAPKRTREDVDWQRLDKQKFLVVGLGLFSGVTTCLYPLTVIKTRQMVLDGASQGFKGSFQTGSAIVQADGIRGLYKGFGTVIFGTIPARVVYLSTLEIMKSACMPVVRTFSLSEAAEAGTINAVAGGAASFITQSVIVPIDVVSQRLMLLGSDSAALSRSGGGASSSGRGMSGLQMARQIIRQDGVRGLYRGLGASLATFVPSSAVWWSAYATYQKLLWRGVDHVRGTQAGGDSHTDVLAVQTGAALLGGMTSAVITNPLDVVKTRLQTKQMENPHSWQRPTFRGTLTELLTNEGPRGLMRGMMPRIASTALWGTAMISVYEFLKRLCRLPDQPLTVTNNQQVMTDSGLTPGGTRRQHI